MPKTDRRTTPPAQRRGFRRFAVIGTLALLGALIAAITIDVAGSQEEWKEQQTGRTGPMGGPVIDIPMEESGFVAVAAVEVEGSHLAMGDVPLDVTVEPTWTLLNTGAEAVSIGEPHASILEGCCPGPLLLGAEVLPPGASTQLTFPLQMHAGMDGPHDFRIHVPVGSAGEVLELGVTGNFGA